MIIVNLYDHAPNVWYFHFVLCTLFFHVFCDVYMHIWAFPLSFECSFDQNLYAAQTKGIT